MFAVYGFGSLRTFKPGALSSSCGVDSRSKGCLLQAKVRGLQLLLVGGL